ncbi:MAG: DHH family phosphoesterase [Patescibacteria group bacterium]|nr:DHH family phosphoesterase [Patescibacteria group bacterium]
MEIKNLAKTKNRILKAIKNNERIILYGDADLDGTASVVILEWAIQEIKGKVSQVFFVDREKQGYGINKTALRYLKKYAPALFIAMDLGITNFEEIEIAKKLGFEVIIIDHHIPLGKVPKADIVVDPKQKNDNYKFKDLCASGIVYRLARILLKDKLTADLDNSFLELTALATIADMMPKEQENKDYIEKGIRSLDNTENLGLRILLDMNFLRGLEQQEKIHKITSILNVSGIKNNLTGAYVFLNLKSEKQAKAIADRLVKEKQQRYFFIKSVTQEIENRISNNNEKSVIFESNVGWPNTIIGTVASKICAKYQKPVFIVNKMPSKSIGTVRMPKNMDAVKAMSACADLLVTFGGHAPAAGFTVQNKNLAKFEKCLTEYFESC